VNSCGQEPRIDRAIVPEFGDNRVALPGNYYSLCNIARDLKKKTRIFWLAVDVSNDLSE
jgi:hypothetical protein